MLFYYYCFRDDGMVMTGGGYHVFGFFGLRWGSCFFERVGVAELSQQQSGGDIAYDFISKETTSQVPVPFATVSDLVFFWRTSSGIYDVSCGVACAPPFLFFFLNFSGSLHDVIHPPQ